MSKLWSTDIPVSCCVRYAFVLSVSYPVSVSMSCFIVSKSVAKSIVKEKHNVDVKMLILINKWSLGCFVASEEYSHKKHIRSRKNWILDRRLIQCLWNCNISCTNKYNYIIYTNTFSLSLFYHTNHFSLGVSLFIVKNNCWNFM